MIKASYTPPYSPVNPQSAENLNYLTQRIGIAEDEGFIGTFSCLGIIKEDTQDIITTLSTLADLSTLINVLDELIETITYIEGITQSLSTIDFAGTFTAIAAIQTTVNEIYGTTTIIQTNVINGFESTFTVLAEIEKNINDDFAGTFTYLQKINNNIDTIKNSLCNPTVIQQSDFGITTFTIDTPGLYIFSENIAFTPDSAQPAIEIITNNVVLDMCDKLLYQNNSNKVQL